MVRIFISHSSRDIDATRQIKGWLGAEGFDQLFLDFDKHGGIPPGADWERTLYREIDRSQAVILLVTSNWLASKWCFSEFTQARALGKAIFPIIVTPECGDKCIVAQDIQHIDLTTEKEGGLDRLAIVLRNMMLKAQGGMEWDPARSPYPGMMYFEEKDAAVFFGRDDDTRRVIERLNARRVQGGAKLLALLAASGAGKSSLLRAGVLPRLKKDRHNWIVLPVFRPQTHPIDELAKSLAMAAGKSATWQELRDELSGDGAANALRTISASLQMEHNANEAQILIPVDQAEELFTTADPRQAQCFFELLNEVSQGGLPLLTLMAMRADFLGDLQKAEELSVRFDEISLKPMPLARIPQIIEGPGRIAGLTIEDALTSAATHDAETEDALPLLAFALRELYERFAGDGNLALADYNALGDRQAGLTPLENAVSKVADEVLAKAAPSHAELTALRAAFIPLMVQVNGEGDYVRKPARWSELPDGGKPLLEQFAKSRLLVIRSQNEEKMVEVAHEALLRKWPRLRSWLDEEREFLVGKQRLTFELSDWQKSHHAKNALLSGNKLVQASQWLSARPADLTSSEREFIAESQRAQRRKVWINRLPLASMIIAALIMLPFSDAILQVSDANAYTLFSKYNIFSLPTWMMLSAASVLGMAMAATYLFSWSLLMFMTKKK